MDYEIEQEPDGTYYAVRWDGIESRRLYHTVNALLRAEAEDDDFWFDPREEEPVK